MVFSTKNLVTFVFTIIFIISSAHCRTTSTNNLGTRLLSYHLYDYGGDDFLSSLLMNVYTLV